MPQTSQINPLNPLNPPPNPRHLRPYQRYLRETPIRAICGKPLTRKRLDEIPPFHKDSQKIFRPSGCLIWHWEKEENSLL
jgi:hypothetical protein